MSLSNNKLFSSIRQPNVLSALFAWVFALNLPFIVLGIFFSFDRGGFILLQLALFLTFALMVRAGIFARHPLSSRLLFYALVFGALCTQLFRFSYYFFGLRGPEMMQALPMIVHLNPASYPLYLIFAVGFFACFTAFLYFSNKGAISRKRDIAIVSIPMVVLAAGDIVVNKTLHFNQAMAFGLSSVASTEAPIAKRSINTREFLAPHLTGTADRDVLFVMVEALGVVKNKAIRDRVFAALDTEEMKQNFIIEQGEVLYEGSTTAAEMRELCGSQQSYLDILNAKFDSSRCLANKFTKNGYHTVSYHGFFGDMFERKSWYPQIGFKQSNFLSDLAQESPLLRPSEYCGATFKGICDRQVGERISHDIMSAKRKRFTYWLTLNSHFPAKRRDDFVSSLDCSEFGLEHDSQICIMSEFWTEVLEQVHTIATSPRSRPIDIVVVGDHAPPLLWRDDREQFKLNRVPYMTLRQK